MTSDGRVCCICGVGARNLAGWVSASDILAPCHVGYECRRTDWLAIPELPSLGTDVERRLEHDLQLYGVLVDMKIAPIDSVQCSIDTAADLARLLNTIDVWATVNDFPIFKHRHWPAAREFALAF
jgi:hypothetical protein